MVKRTYEEWLTAFRRRKILNSPEQKLAYLVLGDFMETNREVIFLEDVPEKHKTAKLCLAAVRRNAFALQFVPEELRTSELCLEAAERDGNALEYVPDKLKEQVKKAVGIELEEEEDDQKNYI